MILIVTDSDRLNDKPLTVKDLTVLAASLLSSLVVDDVVSRTGVVTDTSLVGNTLSITVTPDDGISIDNAILQLSIGETCDNATVVSFPLQEVTL